MRMYIRACAHMHVHSCMRTHACVCASLFAHVNPYAPMCGCGGQRSLLGVLPWEPPFLYTQRGMFSSASLRFCLLWDRKPPCFGHRDNWAPTVATTTTSLHKYLQLGPGNSLLRPLVTLRLGSGWRALQTFPVPSHWNRSYIKLLAGLFSVHFITI